MKKLLVVGILVLMWTVAVAAQTCKPSIAKEESTLTLVPFTRGGCNGDMVTLDGEYTVTLTQWVDCAGDMHTRSSVTSTNLTASSNLGYTYTVMFATKKVENISDGFAGEVTIIHQVKLIGEGSLRDQILLDEIHITNSAGLGIPDSTFHEVDNCTGKGQ